METVITTTDEENAQLKHSLQLKDDLIRDNEEETYPTSPSTPSISGKVYRGGYTVHEHVSQLDERINRLQIENSELRHEIEVTVNKLSDREVEYHKIVDGTVSDYNSVNRRLIVFRKELAQKSQECFDQQEQITRLLTQLVDAQREKRELQQEAEENLNAFEESQHAQMVLMAEFTELEKRYLETVRMLEETQNAARNYDHFIEPDTNTFADELKSLEKIDKQTNSAIAHNSTAKNNESGIFDSSRDMLTSTLEHLSESVLIQNSQSNLNNSLSEVHCGKPLQDIQGYRPGGQAPGRQFFPEPNCTPPHPPIASGAVTPLFSPPGCRSVSVMSSGISTPLIGKAGVPGSRYVKKAATVVLTVLNYLNDL